VVGQRGLLEWVRAHHRGIQRAGGLLMVAVGLLLVTGWWDVLMAGLVQWASSFQVVI